MHCVLSALGYEFVQFKFSSATDPFLWFSRCIDELDVDRQEPSAWNPTMEMFL